MRLLHTAMIVSLVGRLLDRIGYRKKIAGSKREEVTSTLSTGISINHLIGIIIAVAGGILRERLGMEVLFTAAWIFGLGAFIFSLSLERPAKRHQVIV